MTKLKLYNVSYYDETKDEDLVEEVTAYSVEQALFLFNQQMTKRPGIYFVLGAECVNAVSVL